MARFSLFSYFDHAGDFFVRDSETPEKPLKRTSTTNISGQKEKKFAFVRVRCPSCGVTSQSIRARGRQSTRHSLGRPGFGEPGRSRRKGQIYSAPEVLETTNRYNENDGVSKGVHELAFGIVICFGSEEFPNIYAATLCRIDASLHSPTTLHTTASPTAVLVSFCARRLAGVPDLILPVSIGRLRPSAVNHAAPGRLHALAPALSRWWPTA